MTNNKVSTLDFKSAFPLKIFCLKDQKTHTKSTFQYQKPTIAFLSSLIQSQRKDHPNESQHQPEIKNQLKTEILNDNKINNVNFIYRLPKRTYTQHVKNFIKQQNIKTERLLSNIVGNQWTKHQNPKSLTKQEKKEENDNHQNNKIKLYNNVKMLKKDFQVFLKNQSRKKIQKQNPFQKDKSVVSSVPYHQPLITYTPTKVNHQINRVTNHSKHKKIAHKLNKSIVPSMNFRRIENFQWSKLSDVQYNLHNYI